MVGFYFLMLFLMMFLMMLFLMMFLMMFLCVLDKNFCGCGFEDIFLKGFDMFCCFCVCFFIVV